MSDWRGESGQDAWAFEQCGRKFNGTFLDIGCNEPIRWNNTFALEEIGWRGVLIDSNPEYRADIERLRCSPFLCEDARASIPRWQRIKECFADDTIDYLSLDIDENEDRSITFAILENIFQAGLKFRCMTVEHDAYRFGDNPRAKLRELIKANGYSLARDDVEIGQFRGGDMSVKGNGKPFEDWWINGMEAVEAEKLQKT